MMKSETRTLTRPAGTDPISRVQRLIAGDGTAEDDAALRDALRRAVENGQTFEHAFGLRGGWRKALQNRRRRAALASMPWAGSKRATGEQNRKALLRYASTRYPTDRERGGPTDAADAPLYTLLAAHGGKALSEETLRRLASAGPWVKIADAITHAAGDDGAMSIKLRKPVLDPAPTTAEEEDERLAARLPELRRERSETIRRLIEVRDSEIDWSWQPDSEASAVALLLTGRPAAPAEQSMPLPALHARLLRHQSALDKAIALAQRAAARVAERDLERRIAENLPEIHAIVRERCLLAIRLQRVNLALLELEERLGVDRSLGGLPSTGYPLLGAPQAGDEVARLVDALLLVGIISRKDVLGAH
jgi:hypothetical protein